MVLLLLLGFLRLLGGELWAVLLEGTGAAAGRFLLLSLFLPRGFLLPLLLSGAPNSQRQWQLHSKLLTTTSLSCYFLLFTG